MMRNSDDDRNDVALSAAQINATVNPTVIDAVTITPEALSENNNTEEEPTNIDFRTAAFIEPALTGSGLKCQCFPHGVYGVSIVFLSMMAWLVSLSKDGCDYSRIVGPIVADITNNPDTPFVDAGFNHYRAPMINDSGDWVLDYSVQCDEYNLDVVTIDSAWRFATFTTFLSLVVGGGGSLYVLLSLCLTFRESTWRWAGYELLAAVIFQVMTFSWFATSVCHEKNNECTMNYGSRADMLASVLWGASLLCLFRKYPSERKKSRQASNTMQQPPAVVEMSNQSGEVEMANQLREQSVGSALDEHEII